MAVEWLCKFVGVTKEEALEIGLFFPSPFFPSFHFYLAPLISLLGMQMYDRNYIVHVVEKDKGFLNDYLFYHFTPTGDQVYKSSDVYAAEMKMQKERFEEGVID